MNIQAIRQQRADIVNEMRGLTESADGDGRDLTDKEARRFDELKGDLAKAETALQRAEVVADAERRMGGTPVSGGGSDFDAALRDFSLLNAIRSQMGVQGDFGRELEVSQELERRSGEGSRGIRVPWEALTEKRVGLSTGDAGNLIGTDHRGDLAISALYPSSIAFALGAVPLTGLRGNIAIPRQDDTSPAAEWVAENNALTPGDHSFDQVTGSPKSVGSLTEYSRNLMLQSDPTVENFVRADFSTKLAAAVDKGVIQGSGAGAEPQGIIGATGVGTYAATATPTWAEILQAPETVSLANGLSGSLGWALHPGVVRLLRSTVRVASTDSNFIMESPEQLAGYPVQVSTNVPGDGVSSPAISSTMIFGDWSQVVVGFWGDGGVDLLVNPYESTAYKKGNVQIRAFITCDVMIRQPGKLVTVTGVDIS